MSWQGTEQFPIVVTGNPATSLDLPNGTIAYWQTGSYGAALGLLLALTNTPAYYRVLQTPNGLKRITL